MKKLVFLVACLLGFAGGSLVASADESHPEELVYELTAGTERQEISYLDEAGEEVVLSVEYVQPLARIAKGTYKVSKTVKGSWTASYNVKIDSKEKITAATDLSIKALKGSITSSSLTHTSTKATCSFKQKAGTITTSASVTATISNGKLVVK
ncbi:DUF5626 family protein [Enterococcus sp.]|jgi:hypothetical protein|uniref:DUF5626 family protein n=1 Tax=Enterococcus sp. TaxID=35783 RepID=UPI0025B8BAF7|nr:DUF5626 family protein [Enterococcus sp.]